MFDLDREISAWAAAVHAGRCRPGASVDELVDHLWCEIERGREAGLDDEQAFRAAVERLGAASQLGAEHAKNRSAVGTACAVAAKMDGPPPASPQGRRLVVAHAVLWAALLLASAILLKGSDASEVFEWSMIVAFVPVFWGSHQLLLRALRTPES